MALSLLALCAGCAPADVPASGEEAAAVQAPRGPFFGLTPGETPQLPAGGWLSSSLDEYNAVFSSGGDAFFYTADTPLRSFLMATYMSPDGTWSPPAALPFSDPEQPEYDPFLSFDDRRLYFSSRRPADAVSEVELRRGRPMGRPTSHVWYADRTDDGGWAEPVVIPLTGRGDYYTSLTREGDLLFNVWSEGNIYRARPDGAGGHTPELVPEPISGGPREVGDPYISPDGDFMIFRGYGEDSLGRGDLFISFFVDGSWTPRQNLGEPINSARHEMCPWVSADGKWFTFSSGRFEQGFYREGGPTLEELVETHHSADNSQLNLYVMSAAFIERMRPE
ncbi:hypothetical protein ABI59_21770 [Acidobacteria bacterium Mor1]|nr:hypothetical protein ABI59_21770 [Acidobacteria bacterium Mor1]